VKLTDVFVSIATVSALAAAFFSWEAAKIAQISGGKGSHVGNSPIMASGGSMTFRSADGWSCDTVQGQSYHTKCVSASSFVVNSLDWDNVKPPPAPLFGTLGWTGLTATAWTVDIYARDASGNVVGPPFKDVPGVKLCTSSSGQLASAACGGAPNYILIAVEGKSNDPSGKGYLGLVDSRVKDSSAAEQYFDSYCTLHVTSGIPGCEHPGAIVSSLDGSIPGQIYQCKDGNCQIQIDK